MIDWSACQGVERSTDTLSGAWRFKNTRVPVKALFENLESGATVDQFLEWFPGVNREQALAVLAFAEKDDEWDEQMKRDVASGKFDNVLREVDDDIRAGRLSDMP